MSMYGRDPWGGPLEICHDSATDDDRSRNLDIDRGALSRTLDETQQSWLLAGPGDQGRRKKKYVDIGCLVVSRKFFVWTLGVLLAAAVFAGVVAGIAKAIPRRHRPPPPPDDYTVALHKALMFFHAQRCECCDFPAFCFVWGLAFSCEKCSCPFNMSAAITFVIREIRACFGGNLAANGSFLRHQTVFWGVLCFACSKAGIFLAF